MKGREGYEKDDPSSWRGDGGADVRHGRGRAALADTVLSTSDSPTTKEDCKNGGYAKYGFKNQGQCIKAVSTAPPPPAGSLDTSFGNSGKQTVPGTSLEHVVELDNGKLLGLGEDNNGSGVLVQHNANGSLDTSFGNNGKVVSGFLSQVEPLVQPDGKIIVVSHDRFPVNGTFSVWRFLANGAPDTSFGTNGQVTHTTPWPGKIDINDAVLLPDGKIVLAGFVDRSEVDGVLVRLASDGSIDATHRTATANHLDYYGSVSLAADGKYVVAGTSVDPTNTSTSLDFLVRRINPDMSLDTLFGNNGSAILQEEGAASINDLLVQLDGKIVVVGASDNHTTWRVVRYDSTGSLDSSFATGGIADLTPPTNYIWAAARGVSIQDDGKLLVTGRAEQSLTAC